VISRVLEATTWNIVVRLARWRYQRFGETILHNAVARLP